MPSIEPYSDPSSNKGYVVLLHGLALNSWTMWLLKQRLESRGYTVENWGYWSLGSLNDLISHFEKKFVELQEQIGSETPLFIVSHSMGSIITRAVMCRVELPSLKRVVMLSPPHRGSHVASMFGPHLRWLTPLIDELADRADSFVNCLPDNLCGEIGVIAAEWDYVVKEPSTHLACECDHIVLPSRHTGLVWRKSVADQVLHFLEYGRFHRDDCEICLSVADKSLVNT